MGCAGENTGHLTPEIGRADLDTGIGGSLEGMVGQDSRRKECISHGHLGWLPQKGALAGEGGFSPTLGGTLSATFEDFYKAYPRKMARKDAEKAWARMTAEERERAMAALPNHLRYWDATDTGKEFIPYPATWLNGARYDDDIEMPQERIPEKAVAWWASEEGVIAKGKEMGVHPRGGESMAQYKARVVEAARKAA